MLKPAVLIFCVCLYLHAGSQTRLFSTEDGLSNKDVTAITQTKNGYLWFGTSNGLNRYNGYDFVEIDLPGLRNGKITSLYEDTKHQLWIGTWEGLCILDQKNMTLKRFFHEPDTLKSSARSKLIHCIQAYHDGSVLVGTATGELYKFENETSYSLVYKDPRHNNDPIERITNITVEKEGAVWLVKDYGRAIRLDQHFREDPTFSTKVENVHTILPIHGTGDVVLLDSWGAIFRVSGKTGSPVKDQTLDSANAKYKYLSTGVVTSNNEVFAGYNSGALLNIDFKNQKVTDLSRGIEPFITGAPRVLFIDRVGLIWIGTNYGLIRYAPRKKLFDNYLNSPPVSKDKKSIRGILQATNGDIYIGGYSGLFKLHPGEVKPEPLTVRAGKKIASNAYYPYRMVDDSSYLWVVSEVRGFFRIDKKTQRLDFPLKETNDPEKKFFAAYALLQQGNDSLWIGTNKGLFLYLKNNTILIKYKSRNEVKVEDIEITDLSLSGKKNLWIGTRTVGIINLDLDSGIAKTMKDESGKLNFITCLYSEGDSILWAGTRGFGLARINTKTSVPIFYTKKEGLADNSVASVLRDSYGTYWIATFNGLSKFNNNTKKFENYFEKDGLTDNEFNVAASLLAKDGKIYLGGLNGINAFYPWQLKKENTSAPRIYLTRVLSFDRENNQLAEQTGDLSDVNELNLSFTDKYCSFTVSMDNYINPTKNTYSYLLEGYDKEWTNLGTLNTITFNGLSSGKYRLLIKGTDPEGFATENVLSINLNVSEVFYKEAWFFLLLGVCGILITYAIMQYRANQRLKLQRLRTKISSDLHDEVGGLLTRISVLAELAKNGISSDSTGKDMEKIADTSRQATLAMNDVLWSIDARNDSIGSLIERMREHSGDVLFPLEMEVTFKLKGIDPEKEVESNTRRNLFLIFKEAINNIARHSGATCVNVLIEKRQREFILLIEDNGKGVATSTHRSGQGLHNMKMRAESIGGELTIVTTVGFKVILSISNFSWR